MAYFEQSEWNNVRLQKQHEREILEKKIEQRRYGGGSGADVGAINEMSVSAYGAQKMELVGKLRASFDRIIPNLPDNEYIIMIDKHNLVDRGYPFDKQTTEEIVRYLQTYKKYMSISMTDPKKLMGEQTDYQSLIQRDAVPTSCPDMLIPPSVSALSIPPSVSALSAVVSPMTTPIVTPIIDTVPSNYQSTPLTASQTTPVTSLYFASTPLRSSYESASVEPSIQLHVEPVVPQAVPSVAPQVPTQSITEPIQQVTQQVTTPSIVKEEHPAQIQEAVIESGSPTSFTINYVTDKHVDTDVSRPIYFTSLLCTDSLIRRYKIHTMPYVLLVINSKYKIPLYLQRNPNGYYEFHKRKGPFYASRVSIQLFDHVNEPIVFKHTPMELCHIQFETRID